MSGAPPTAPDRPPVPRARWPRFTKIVAAVSGVIVTCYAYIAFTGFEFDAPAREEVPASVRASPGGYRTYHFWHSGYHGGK